jgi:hypothetical protein
MHLFQNRQPAPFTAAGIHQQQKALPSHPHTPSASQFSERLCSSSSDSPVLTNKTEASPKNSMGVARPGEMMGKTIGRFRKDQWLTKPKKEIYQKRYQGHSIGLLSKKAALFLLLLQFWFMNDTIACGDAERPGASPGVHLQLL